MEEGSVEKILKPIINSVSQKYKLKCKVEVGVMMTDDMKDNNIKQKIDVVVNLASSNEFYPKYSKIAFKYQYGDKTNENSESNDYSSLKKKLINEKENENDTETVQKSTQNELNFHNKIENKNDHENENENENEKVKKNLKNKSIVTTLFKNKNHEKKRKLLSNTYTITGSNFISISSFGDNTHTDIVAKSDLLVDKVYQSIFYKNDNDNTADSSSSSSSSESGSGSSTQAG